MNFDIIFAAGSMLAGLGWLALLASPWLPNWSQRLAGTAVPAVIGVIYAALMLAFFATSPGGYSSLSAVEQLFSSRPVLLAGWLHYLAFDLAIGAWEVRDAQRRGLAFGWVVPCLATTLLFGPAGFLLYLLIRGCVPRRAALAA